MTFTSTFRAISRSLKRLILSTFVRKKRNNNIYLSWYSKDVQRTKCQALTIVRSIIRARYLYVYIFIYINVDL